MIVVSSPGKSEVNLLGNASGANVDLRTELQALCDVRRNCGGFVIINILKFLPGPARNANSAVLKFGEQSGLEASSTMNI